jgi:hypothetical protein
LQGPGTDQNTVQQIRDAISARKDITVQLLNYTKSGTYFMCHFCFIPFSVQMYIQQFLFGPPAAGAVEGLFGLDTMFRTWHLKI